MAPFASWIFSCLAYNSERSHGNLLHTSKVFCHNSEDRWRKRRFLYFEVVAVSILFFLCKSVKKWILSHFAFIFSHKNRKIFCIILVCVSHKLSIDILGFLCCLSLFILEFCNRFCLRNLARRSTLKKFLLKKSSYLREITSASILLQPVKAPILLAFSCMYE